MKAKTYERRTFASESGEVIASFKPIAWDSMVGIDKNHMSVRFCCESQVGHLLSLPEARKLLGALSTAIEDVENDSHSD